MRAAVAFALVVVAAGCSWSAFEEFKHDTPVYAFSNDSFGARVGISNVSDGTAYFAEAGSTGEGSRLFFVGDGRSDPSGVPLNPAAQCTLGNPNTPCLLASALVGVGALTDTSAHQGCFALGFGKLYADGVPAGPVAYCADGEVFTLGHVPSGPPQTKDSAPKLTAAFANRNQAQIRALSVSLASIAVGSGNPPLMLGDEADNAAYVYRSIEQGAQPTLLAQPSRANRFGHVVAMGKGAGTVVFAVGAPDDGTVYVYSGDPADLSTIEHDGCTNAAGAGSADVVAFGDVDADALDDLLVAERSPAGRLVQIYLGKDRPGRATGDCGNRWTAGMTLHCSPSAESGSCEPSDTYASSIAVGDLDGDGANEVAVGAPSANGNGAVYLYTPSKTLDVRDVRSLAQPESGASFGASIAIGKIGGQDTLVVAAPGTGKGYVAWCTQLPGAPGGPRCRK